MNELVSVVVPIYNVERYIDRCVSSIINQTYRNLEILMIDDGSPDNCPRICDGYAERDSRIKVIHKKNEGLGMARNTGIEHATGEYICFFDSDDYIEPDTIEYCVGAAVKYNADMVIFGKDNVTPDGQTLGEYSPCPPKQLFCGEEITKALLPMSIYPDQKTGEDWGIEHSAWNKLYSMKVINKTGWRFVSEREIISEDFYSLTELYGHLDRVFVSERVFYHYTVNGNSLSHSYTPERFERIKAYYGSMFALCDRMGLHDLLDQSVKGITFGFCIGAMKQIVASDLNFIQRYKQLKNIIKDGCLQEIVRGTCYSGCGFQKKLLYTAAKYKLAWICFFIVYLKNKRTALQ